MLIQENINLAEYTTFKIGGPARFFCAVSDETALAEAVGFAKKKNLPIFVIGGGSNVLISDSGFPGLVVKMEIMGIKEQEAKNKKLEARSSKLEETQKAKEKTSSFKLLASGSNMSSNEQRKISDDMVIVSVGAGELWDGFVDWTVERGLYGVENLSAIPGTVGAAPVQNIAAYGGEAAHTITSVRALDTRSMGFVELSNADCLFGYRNSIFKREKGRHVITRVDFKLAKDGKANIGYKDLKEYLSGKGIASPSVGQVREAVIAVRWKKLPDWKLWGTAGSFFKNPIIDADRFAALKERYPGLPGFPEPDGRVKASLGWILDKVCDVKGLHAGKACVYEKQALVLVAKPGACAEEVVNLSRDLMKRVKDRTGIDIESEVEWVN